MSCPDWRPAVVASVALLLGCTHRIGLLSNHPVDGAVVDGAEEDGAVDFQEAVDAIPPRRATDVQPRAAVAQTPDPECHPGDMPAPAAWLLFDSLRDLNRDLYAVHTGTCELRRLTYASSAETSPVASPAGDRVAFESTQSGSRQIMVGDLQSGFVTPLSAMPAGAEQPAWSPDGSKIVFVSGGAVYLATADGSGAPVKINLPPITTGSATYEYPQFFDADNLAVVAAARLTIFTRQGTTVRTLLEPGTSSLGRVAILEERQLVMYQAFCGTPTLQIRVAPLGALTVACKGTGVGPGWSPVVDRDDVIAVSLGENNGVRQIGIYKENQTPRVLTQSTSDSRNPWWLPGEAAPNAILQLP